MKKLFAFVSVLTLIALATPGCHTVQGAGKDIQAVGEKGQEVIDPKGQK